MANEDIDPLGQDWKSRGERGTAILREIAIEEAAGKSIPIDPLSLILSDLAGRVSGLLQAIPERIRDLGLSEEAVATASEVVVEAQLQISVALDHAAEEAMGAVDAIEDALSAQGGEESLEPVRGPKERKMQTHKGKPSTGNAKAKPPKVPGRKK